MWDMLGVADTVAKMEAAGYEVAEWVKEMLDAGHSSFYQNGSYYDFDTKRYKLKEPDKNIVLVKDLKKTGKEVEHNTSASILDMGDGVALLEFHAKMNAIDDDIVQMAYRALDRLVDDFDALIIGNNGQDFCVGANIAVAGIAAVQGLWDQIDKSIHALQDVSFKLRHAPKPVVTAPHQRVLGGGVEFSMAGWSSVADHETYMGFVEVGVGLIPAGGGCKEMLRRKINPVMSTRNADVLPVMQEVFQQLATAQVGTSAWQDRSLGYLSDTDVIVMNGDHRLAAAKRKALQLVATGARPPEVEKVYAAGRDMYSALKLGLAYVLCGGDLSAPTWVDPWYILDLEREAFKSLLGEEKTRDRITHMLQTGKPLRN
jgi:3-hydroxyacyl-CoA dehydrogenase